MRKWFVGLLVAGAACFGAAAPPAHAAGLEFEIEDEGLLLSNPQLAPDAVNSWKKLGVDTVRVHARWWQIAPGASATKRPAGFVPTNPNDPQYNWHALDVAVNLVRSAGIKVMLSVTGPGPLWTSGSPSKKEPRYKPKASEYAAFAQAVGDPLRRPRRPLPDLERAQPEGLAAAAVGAPAGTTGSRSRRTSTAIWCNAASPVIKKADPGAEIVIGELAPVGNRPISAETPMKPLPFLRSFGCVDDKYKTLKTGLCRKFKEPKGTTLGYHPHPKKLAPDKANKDVDDAQFADLPRLFSAIDKLRKRHRISVSSNVNLTEFGYETNPPDKASGVSLALQARYLQQATYLAWKDKRVRGLSFYQWDDEPTLDLGSGTKKYSNWQTGLRFNDSTPKPALSVMPAPFVIDQVKNASSATLWGQVRPDANPQVTIQTRAKGASDWTDVATVNTGTDGLWSKKDDDQQDIVVSLPLAAEALAGQREPGRAHIRDRRPVDQGEHAVPRIAAVLMRRGWDRAAVGRAAWLVSRSRQVGQPAWPDSIVIARLLALIAE